VNDAAPTPERVRRAALRHFECWNAGRRAEWIANFSEDVVFHDPVGKPPKHGRTAAERSWDNSFTNGLLWTLELARLVVCGDEAAITLRNHGTVASRRWPIVSLSGGVAVSIYSVLSSLPEEDWSWWKALLEGPLAVADMYGLHQTILALVLSMLVVAAGAARGYELLLQDGVTPRAE
jgi:hypothetical protein